MMTLSQLARLLEANAAGVPSDPIIARVSSIRQADGDSLVFADDGVSFASALDSGAAAVLASPEIAGGYRVIGKPVLLVPQPRLAFARAAKFLARSSDASLDQEVTEGPTAHPTAAIAPTAHLGKRVSIGPYAVIEDDARIGAGSMIGSGAVIGKAVVVGEDCRIYPRAVLYPGTSLGNRVVVHAGAVLGGDGFGYVCDRITGEYTQFPQQGKLIIEDDVEIGANTTIDRGALEETRIARGAKLDNLVHVGHNVLVGRNTVIAAQTGISGSSIIGNNAVLGGQVGIGDHAIVGDGVILGGQAGVLPKKKVRGNGVLFWGTPAQPLKRYLKQLAALARLSRSPQEEPNAKRREEE